MLSFSAMEDEQFFHKCDGTQITLKEVVEEIIRYIKEDPSARYKVIIGTDSEDHNGVDFVSAVVVLRIGKGGRYFWRRMREDKKYVLRDRIYQEVLLSLKLAEETVKLLRVKEFLNYDFEIHVDVGVNGETKMMLAEVVGMVRGSGFEAKIKPESFGASCVADRHV